MDEARLEPHAYRRFREASGTRLALELLVSVALHVGLLRRGRWHARPYRSCPRPPGGW